MFPSDNTYPAVLPNWLLDGHELTAGERVAPTQYEQGEDRQREIRTFTPYLVSVSTFLEQEEFDRFSEWYENDIQGGTLLFDTQVASFDGIGKQWWQARFLGSYRAEPQHLDRFIVSAELILLDGPYDVEDEYGDAVRVVPGIAGRSIGDSEATASFSSPGMRGWSEGDSELWAISSNSLNGWSEGESDGEAEFSPQSLLLLEGGVDFLLLEGGTDRIYLEP